MSRYILVNALMDIPYLITLCKEKGIKLDRTTQMEVIGSLLNVLGPHLSYKLIQYLMKKKVYNWADEDFEVEEILDHWNEKDEDYFLVKWKGWTCSFNSWERKKNLKCQELLEAFEHKKHSKTEEVIKPDTREEQLETIHLYLSERYDNNLLDEIVKAIKDVKRFEKMMRVRRTKITVDRKLNKNSTLYKKCRAELESSLSSLETRLNRGGPGFGRIYVENKVDLETVPSDFVYISSCIPSQSVVVENITNPGCKCKDGDCFSSRHSCCGEQVGYEFAYNKQKRLRLSEGQAIYECNSNCTCSEACPNRVVQLGRKVSLCLFRTGDGKGWGVKSVNKIPKGTFVEEYVGEVITSEEAEKRGKVYDTAGLTYLFDLDFHEKDCAFTIDAKTYGNISHFINHSCDPNLAVFNVWIDNADGRLPRIALFAIKDIKANEELTFDYKMNIGSTTSSQEDVTSPIADESLSLEAFACCDLASGGSEVRGTDNVTSVDIPAAVESDDSPPDSTDEAKKVEESYASTENSLENLAKDCRNILDRSSMISSAPNVRSESPCSNSVSMPDFVSLAESCASDVPGRMLRSLTKKAKKKYNDSKLKTENWVRSGGAFTHRTNSGVKVSQTTMLRALEDARESFPSTKRMRIACVCRSKRCRKWLC